MLLLLEIRPLLETRDIISLIALTVSILAFFFSPRYQKNLERKKEAHSRRVNIFKILMATRASRLSYRHVEALNMVDLEFLGNEYSAVLAARNNYYDNLFNRNQDPSFISAWADKNDDLLAGLLFEMGKALKYNYKLVDIKRNVYIPQAHVTLEEEENYIRKSIVTLLQNGQGTIPMRFEQDDELMKDTNERQAALQDLMMQYYSEKLKKHLPNQ
jgi:hypothetical protein